MQYSSHITWNDVPCPMIHYHDTLMLFKPSQADSPHAFGGALPCLSGAPSLSHIHALFHFDASMLDVLSDIEFKTLPLLFPFKHDGGCMDYRIHASGEVSVLSVQPETAVSDWPYDDYPNVFSPVPFELSEQINITRDEFTQKLSQGLPQDESLVVVIPPSEDYGVSLWGEMGDDEHVLCLFYIDPTTGNVKVENQCS